MNSLYLKTNKCSVGKLFDKLDKETRTELEEIVADPQVPLQALARLADAKGWKIHRDTFQRHRERKCRCES
jgi:hypothetical protein